MPAVHTQSDLSWPNGHLAPLTVRAHDAPLFALVCSSTAPLLESLQHKPPKQQTTTTITAAPSSSSSSSARTPPLLAWAGGYNAAMPGMADSTTDPNAMAVNDELPGPASADHCQVKTTSKHGLDNPLPEPSSPVSCSFLCRRTLPGVPPPSHQGGNVLATLSPAYSTFSSSISAAAAAAAAAAGSSTKRLQSLQLNLRRLTVALCRSLGHDDVAERANLFFASNSHNNFNAQHETAAAGTPVAIAAQTLAATISQALVATTTALEHESQPPPLPPPAKQAVADLFESVLNMASISIRHSNNHHYNHTPAPQHHPAATPFALASPALVSPQPKSTWRMTKNATDTSSPTATSLTWQRRHSTATSPSVGAGADQHHPQGDSASPPSDPEAMAMPTFVDFNASVASASHRPPAALTHIATLRAENHDSHHHHHDIRASFDASGECMVDDGFMVNQYLIIDKIGAGRQGEVFIAEDTVTGEARAIKVVKRPSGMKLRVSSSSSSAPRASRSASRGLAAARDRQAEQLMQEVDALRQCRHKNIVALHEVIDDPSDDRLYLVLDYVDRGPIAVLQPDGTCATTFSIFDLTRYARQLCAGLVYLHSHGIVHRDIKPDNILHDRNGNVYWTDFGMAELFDTAESNGSSGIGNLAASANGNCVWGTRGTVAFMAPELFSATESQGGTPGEAVDVWALGVTFYVLLFGRLPWNVHSTGGGRCSVMDQISDFDPATIPNIPLPPSSTSTLRDQPLTSTHRRRPNAEEENLVVLLPEVNQQHQRASTPPAAPEMVVRGPTPSNTASVSPMSFAADPDATNRRSFDFDTSSAVGPPSLDNTTSALPNLLPLSYGASPSMPLINQRSDFPSTIAAASASADHQAASGKTARDESSATQLTLERVAGLWRELLRHMLAADPAHRISALDMRKRIRDMVDLLEACGGPGGALMKTPLAGLTPMW